MESNPGPRLTSKLFKIPLYIEINDLIVPSLYESGVSSYLLSRVRKHQESDFKQSASLFIPSVPRRNWIINQYNMPEDRVHLVLNGTEVNESKQLDRLQAKNRLGLSQNSFCLGFIGTIYERYDFKSILQIILKCQDLISELILIIIGDGPMRSEIEKVAVELGLVNKIIFTGYIEPEKLGNIIPAFDLGLMILDKKNSDSAGPVHTKLSTYAMYGLPVLTAGSSLKGYPEELIQGLYIVPPENPSAMADKTLHIYNSPKERNERAKILHDYAAEKLTWNAVTERILNIMRHDMTLKQSDLYGEDKFYGTRNF
jgi:glycosyltransferase involved in cell wall biosynthesis